jgi:hypothetical protein
VTQLSQREQELIEKRAHLDPDDQDDREQLCLFDAELFASPTLFIDNAIDERAQTGPARLDNIHRELDAAVAAAYGWPVDRSDDEILARLFELNQERAGTVKGASAAERVAAD